MASTPDTRKIIGGTEGVTHTEHTAEKFANITKLRKLLIALVKEQQQRTPAAIFVEDTELEGLPAFEKLLEKAILLNERVASANQITDTQLISILKPILVELWSVTASTENSIQAAKFADSKTVLTKFAQEIDFTYSERNSTLYFVFKALHQLHGLSARVEVTVDQNYNVGLEVSVIKEHTKAQLAEILQEIGLPLLLDLIISAQDPEQSSDCPKTKRYTFTFEHGCDTAKQSLTELNNTINQILSKSNNWGSLQKNIKFIDLQQLISIVEDELGDKILNITAEKLKVVLCNVAREYSLEVNPALQEQRNRLLAFLVNNPGKIALIIGMLIAEAAVIQPLVWDAIQAEKFEGDDFFAATYLILYILITNGIIVSNHTDDVTD